MVQAMIACSGANMLDIRNQPSIEIVDTYTKSGKHLGTVAKTLGGDIIWEEGRTPIKDVVFFGDCGTFAPRVRETE
jgi:hypothetical protein